ncbi:hypothetical protein DSM104443_04180 [Usitatibacter rugosus]|uniref:DUF4124 domain-containing protein n=1 Tax=Usitatibacter rugosus TaxID=2732067 RepID=A0A6M4H0Q4_9PROT|nr:DUF4124 domain-containing protein [Usitatibacter rugosus]QJR13086.1 hypothetical protein DSM104443_04180 [Usitatibacter rugosus]
MKKLWIATFLAVTSASALAQSTIYKHVDANGRVTYTNKPMKDAAVVELEPLTLIPATPTGMLQPQGVAAKPPAAPTPAPASAEANIKPAVAIVTAMPSASAVSFPKVDTSLQKKRDEERRRILEEELKGEEDQLSNVRRNLGEEQRNPELVAVVRMAQATADPTPSQQVELRNKLEKASGRIRGLQATAAEHEKNIEALKKELGALKP